MEGREEGRAEEGDCYSKGRLKGEVVGGREVTWKDEGGRKGETARKW